MLSLFAFITALFVTMVLIPPLCKYAERMGFVDYPDARKVHKGLVPRIGGIAIVLGAILPMILWLPGYREVIAFLSGIMVIFIFGAWDDRAELDYKLKFFGQIAAVVIVMLYGGVLVKVIPFIQVEDLPMHISVPLTFVILLGITNAINLADGLDGLAGGITLLSFAGLGILAYLSVDGLLLIILMSIMGSIIGFLRYNTYPARVFMGDTGSQFLGFSVGVLAILLTQDEDFHFSIALPVLLLGLPVLDTVMVMLERIKEGVSPFKPDKKHIHHRLLAIGLDHYEAVFVIYVIQSLLVSSAYFLRFQSDQLIIAVYILLCIIVVSFFSWTKKSAWKISRAGKDSDANNLVNRIRGINRDDRLSTLLFKAIAVFIGCYFAWVSLTIAIIPQDISIMSLVLFLMLAALYIYLKGSQVSLVEKMSIFVCIVVIVYLSDIVNTSDYVKVSIYENIFFLMLTVLVVAALRLSHSNNFQLTTMDFLVLFIAFTVPNIITIESMNNIGIMIAKVMVLFYAMEYVLVNVNEKWNLIRLIFISTFGLLALRMFI